MANTVITITIPEGDVNKVIKALCRSAGVEPSGANAKAALVAYVKNLVVEEDQLNKQQAFAATTAVVPLAVT